MKSSRVHSVLGEVHRLLGEYTAAEFQQASEYEGITPSLRDALRALTREASSDDYSPPTDKTQSPKDPVASRSSPVGRADSTLEITNLIRHAKRFNGTKSILQFAKEAGLNVLARPKESRERIARRVAEAILQSPEPKREQIIAQLAGDADSQTQGWIDVIKNARP